VDTPSERVGLIWTCAPGATVPYHDLVPRNTADHVGHPLHHRGCVLSMRASINALTEPPP